MRRRRPRAFTANDLSEAMKRRLAPTGPQLSPREKEVLQLLADGLGVAQISKQLYISESTTKTHISKLYEKLGAANRAQALMSALRLGLITQDGPPAGHDRDSRPLDRGTSAVRTVAVALEIAPCRV